MNHASLCVLSYNRPQMLDRCIESIYATADYPFELIVHDDGSSAAGIHDVLDRARYRSSTVITNRPGHNQGVGEAVRRMFQLASGDFLFKIDQDCTFEPGWLSEMVHILESYAWVGTVGGFRYWHDPVDHAKMLRAEHDEWDEVEDYVSSVFGIESLLWDDGGEAVWETHSDAFAEDVAFKRTVSSWHMCHALTKRDMVHNDGFGVGPSTVVPEHGRVATIHHGPYIHVPEAA